MNNELATLNIEAHDGTTFTAKIPASLESQIVQMVYQYRSQNANPKLTSPPQHKATPTSIPDLDALCSEHNVKKHYQFALATGVFLASKGNTTFTKQEYRDIFFAVKGQKERNAPSNLKRAVDEGWLINISDDTFKVTAKGHDVLRNKFV